ncbi:hypothetical protein [Nocardia anaemiae]|uniref:hypothetical protein n=1 Tax=Nocardia anaemiae TaxID=263910 RepID=UPI0007A442EC|nr:hypothetical protein [Nocardia anaemiae]
MAGAARIGSTLTSLNLLSEVVLPWLLLDESVTLTQAIGGVLVVGWPTAARNTGPAHRWPTRRAAR